MLWITSLIGKIVVFLTRHLWAGHGSALPGLVVEKIYPSFLKKVLASLPGGVVLISGTNGKTTTTKIVADLLKADGYKVFTNQSGSNYTRGVISAALRQMKRGKLVADIAVLELDEIYATQFVDQVRPRYSLLLNVLRDQLDRFGEIDNTAKMLGYVASHTSRVVVLNEDDPRLAKLGRQDNIKAKIAWFGCSDSASQYYCCDDDLHSDKKRTMQKVASNQSVRLIRLEDRLASYSLGTETQEVRLKIFGIHNALNCAAALSLVREIEGAQFNFAQTVDHLGEIKPAYGRGEIITVGEVAVRLILVKNPSGFQLALDSATNDPALIAINDAYADGRDVSWLWDVSFKKLATSEQNVAVTGERAEDIAIRLCYDQVPVKWVEPDLALACRRFVNNLTGGDGQIFATYTAMLKIRDQLEQMNQEDR